MLANDDLIELTANEILLLSSAFNELRGSASVTEEVARLAGFESLLDLYEGAGLRIHKNLVSYENVSLHRKDIRRALTLAEIIFINDRVGSGLDWEACTGLPDVATLSMLRSLQYKVLSHSDVNPKH